jgi:hypothetical protein
MQSIGEFRVICSRSGLKDDSIPSRRPKRRLRTLKKHLRNHSHVSVNFSTQHPLFFHPSTQSEIKINAWVWFSCQHLQKVWVKGRNGIFQHLSMMIKFLKFRLQIFIFLIFFFKNNWIFRFLKLKKS